jgi:hypothetical protein
MVRELVLNAPTNMTTGHQKGCRCGGCTANTYADVAGEARRTSRSALSATLGTEHVGAGKRAVTAMQSANEKDHDEAVSAHTKAAKMHEKAATACRVEGDQNKAVLHDRAAALHRKAASFHSIVTDNAQRPRQLTANDTVDPDDVLPLPTINWAQAIAEQKGITFNAGEDAHSFDGAGNYPGSGPYSDPTYGSAPTVRQSGAMARIIDQPNLDEDGNVIPDDDDDEDDGRQLARVRRVSPKGAAVRNPSGTMRDGDEEDSERAGFQRDNENDAMLETNARDTLSIPTLNYQEIVEEMDSGQNKRSRGRNKGKSAQPEFVTNSDGLPAINWAWGR